jgi:hypothetical protein
MFELLSEPPPPEAIAKMTAIEGVRIVPTALTIQQGPDRHLGPGSGRTADPASDVRR